MKNPEMGSQEPEEKNIYVENLEMLRRDATELQKNVEETQSAKYGATLLRLMKRTEDNKELINNLNEFLNALEHQSRFRDSDKPLSGDRQEDLANFFKEATKALRWTVGHGERPADIKIDLNEWELNKK